MKLTSNYKKYQSSNPIQKFLIGRFFHTIFACLRPLEINSVLDVGCGEGFVLSKLKIQGIGRFFEGIDFSDKALELGRAKFPQLSLKKGNIYKLPYENNFCDLVICTEVLEHLERPSQALNEIVRVSRRYSLFSVPNEPFFRIANLMRGKNIFRWGNDIDHIQSWTSGDFEKFIAEKLSIISVIKSFPWTIILGEKKSRAY